MQFKHRKISAKCCKVKRKKHGFALIASLTLMMLLTMLAVGILAMASSQNRIAAQTVLQSQARMQALMGLDAAIGELQVELGPDQRVTASSSILAGSDGAKAQHILGVWNSWDGPIYGKSASGKGSSITSTYGKGREPMFRRWLISSSRPQDVYSMSKYTSLSDQAPGRRICLVGEGTLGTLNVSKAADYVYADLITMELGNRRQGCFAWWVGGENQKSKITFQNPKPTDSPIEALHRTWDTPAPIFIKPNASIPDVTAAFKQSSAKGKGTFPAEKILTMASLPLVEKNSRNSAGMPYFFDVTTTSYTLPVNVRDGGLKKDLCLLLNRESLRGTGYDMESDSDRPIVPREYYAGRSSVSHLPIGSWQVMHAYYNCWPNGKGKDDDFGTRLVGNMDTAYTRMAGDIVADTNSTYYDPRADLSKGIGYPRVPVMLAFMNNFGLVLDDFDGKVTTDTKEPLYKLRMCFAPMVLWWNPYNVPMKIRGNKLWAQSVPYKSMWLQTYTKGYGWKYSWGTYAMRQSSGADGFGQDWGNYFQSTLGGDSQDIIFAPGEIVFFSPGKARITDDYTKQYSNPWVEGYHPTSVSAYKAHFYGVQGKHDQDDVTSGYNIDQGKFKLGIRLGIESGDGSYNADGYWFAPRRNEAMTVYNGYAGMGAGNDANGSIGKRGESPQRFLLGWYDPSNPECKTELCMATWETQGQDDPASPYFIVSVGMVAKSANRYMDQKLYPDKDYRTKVWQHSSPAFWGGIIINPDDQQRQYHPYQFAAYNVGGGVAAAPMDNIGRNGMLGITSDGEQVSFASVCELPMHPPFSLAGFAGMRLQPGWFKTGTAGTVAMRRAQYQNGVPGVGIGNSFADPCIPADGYMQKFAESKIPDTEGNNDLLKEFYDHGLMINDALWDAWFCSSISDMPGSGGSVVKAKQVLENFLEGKDSLPVSRYKRARTAPNNATITSSLFGKDSAKAFEFVAQYLVIDGGFNVNSTSEDAWASLLQGLADRKLVTNVSGRLQLLDDCKKQDNERVVFSRFMVSTSSKSLDSLGGYSVMQGSTSLRPGNSNLSAWGEVRLIRARDIRELARMMVEIVRERGPFLNMSDFINRRLTTDKSGKHGHPALKGALQAAIDDTSINDIFKEVEITEVPSGRLYKFAEAEKGSLYTAAPGYLIQSDVLASLGNILTVRDDTFTIRAYGCVRNENNAILAQAWCEAVVQRTIDYVDPKDTPEKKPNELKKEINKVMGRKFRIVSFKWLDAWDV